MIKRISFILFSALITSYSQSQIITALPGSDITIQQGTMFTIDSLVLTPSSALTLSNVSVSKNTVVSFPSNNVYISRVYKFSSSTNAFSGSIQMSYLDGAELNGLSESDLQLNIHDGINWQSFTSTTNDIVNNFVLTNSLSGIQLNELTLAASGFALPLQWRSFVATKQQENVLLEWSTFSEQNTRNFIVETSTNGNVWTSLATVAAAGNASSASNYNYPHTTPAEGYNYYRIVETDKDGRQNYSVVQKIFFSSPSSYVQLLGNPVVNGTLIVKVNIARQNDKAPMLKLYASDGKLLLQQQGVEGINNIKVNGFAKGTYLLQANSTTIKFLIQ